VNPANVAIVFSLGLFVAMLGALELGRRVRERRHRADPEGTIGGGTVDGGVFALLGLLLAFSFTGAATRFDIGTSRVAALRAHIPVPILVLLFVAGLLAAVLAGYGMWSAGGRDWLHIIVFAAVTALTTSVILDLEYPSVGLIRLDDAEMPLIEVRDAMR
jgi:hypothetical protein